MQLSEVTLQAKLDKSSPKSKLSFAVGAQLQLNKMTLAVRGTYSKG
jgi:hypothetical protein